MNLTDRAKASEGEFPLRFARVYAAELLFRLGEEGRAIEVLRDAQRNADLAGEASRIFQRFAQS